MGKSNFARIFADAKAEAKAAGEALTIKICCEASAYDPSHKYAGMVVYSSDGQSRCLLTSTLRL
jgi:hypothetical protein